MQVRAMTIGMLCGTEGLNSSATGQSMSAAPVTSSLNSCVHSLAFLIGDAVATHAVMGAAQHTDVQRLRSKLRCLTDRDHVIKL